MRTVLMAALLIGCMQNASFAWSGEIVGARSGGTIKVLDGAKAQVADTETSDALSPALLAAATASFQCGAKRTCGQMDSCEEAQFHFTQCGLTRLDGDSDGVPCEKICR